MKRIGVKFVRWYNRKYSRVGHLFQGRYGSVPIEDQRAFLTVFRYIHQNPIHGGAEKVLGSYRWSSWQEYAVQGESWIDKEGILEYFGSEEACLSFLRVLDEEQGYEGRDGKQLSDEEGLEYMKEVSGCASHIEFLRLDIRRRDAALRKLYRCGVGERQMSRITGVSRGVIKKALTNLE